MTGYGNLNVEVRFAPGGHILDRSYHWTGPPVIMIDPQILASDEIQWEGERMKSGSKFRIGPFRMMLTDREAGFDPYCVAVRLTPRGIAWLLSSGLARSLGLAYRRIITTLAVWNLASYRTGALPSWRDIRLPRRKRETIR